MNIFTQYKYNQNLAQSESIGGEGDRVESHFPTAAPLLDAGSEWYFDGVKTTSSSVALTSGTHEVKFVGKKGSTTETIVQEITVR